MKPTILYIAAPLTLLTFLCSYFMELTVSNSEQYLATTLIIFSDGFFGVIGGIKREGFKTFKALKIIKTLFFWILILTLVLSIEKGFDGVNWLSETLITPFLVFQLASVVKNASMAGFINNELMNNLLDKIDKHKGERKE
jgi:phage-related holin